MLCASIAHVAKKALRGGPQGAPFFLASLELELELIQSHMAQKPVLRGEVGARALRVRSDVRGLKLPPVGPHYLRLDPPFWNSL